MTKDTKFQQKDNPPKLKVIECPFCEGGELWTAHKNRVYSINCYSCEAIGPKAETQEEAVRLWNHNDD